MKEKKRKFKMEDKPSFWIKAFFRTISDFKKNFNKHHSSIIKKYDDEMNYKQDIEDYKINSFNRKK